MDKRFWWIFIVMVGVGTLVWLGLPRGEPKTSRTGAIFNPETSADRPAPRNSDLAGEVLNQEIARESLRHSTGEIEKHQAEQRRLFHLKRAIRDQEDKVEEGRKVLSTIVRTKGIIYRGPDADHSDKAQTPEDTIKKALGAQDYVDAKRDFETDQILLQELRLKLISEKTVNQPSGK